MQFEGAIPLGTGWWLSCVGFARAIALFASQATPPLPQAAIVGCEFRAKNLPSLQCTAQSDRVNVPCLVNLELRPRLT
jgi:hypothetical protein